VVFALRLQGMCQPSAILWAFQTIELLQQKRLARRHDAAFGRLALCSIIHQSGMHGEHRSTRRPPELVRMAARPIFFELARAAARHEGVDAMPSDLPTPVAKFIAAENAEDADALARCFMQDAVVRDERRTHTGRPAIRAWNADAKTKYRHTIAPLHSATRDGKTVVRMRLTGSFPGSPVEVDFAFTPAGDEIARLEIG
jgi:hypothetical protein